MKKIILASFILLGLIACEKDNSPKPTIKDDPKFINDLRTMSVDTLDIGNQSFVLDAYLWRDFMPVSPPDGQAMIAINKLISIDSTAIPNGLNMVEQYVIKGSSVWIAPYEPGSTNSPNYILERISRNGPKWGPKIYVDVVSKLNDSITGADYFIKLDSVYIVRTD